MQLSYNFNDYAIEMPFNGRQCIQFFKGARAKPIWSFCRTLKEFGSFNYHCGAASRLQASNYLIFLLKRGYDTMEEPKEHPLIETSKKTTPFYACITKKEDCYDEFGLSAIAVLVDEYYRPIACNTRYHAVLSSDMYKEEDSYMALSYDDLCFLVGKDFKEAINEATGQGIQTKMSSILSYLKSKIDDIKKNYPNIEDACRNNDNMFHCTQKDGNFIPNRYYYRCSYFQNHKDKKYATYIDSNYNIINPDIIEDSTYHLGGGFFDFGGRTVCTAYIKGEYYFIDTDCKIISRGYDDIRTHTLGKETNTMLVHTIDNIHSTKFNIIKPSMRLLSPVWFYLPSEGISYRRGELFDEHGYMYIATENKYDDTKADWVMKYNILTSKGRLLFKTPVSNMYWLNGYSLATFKEKPYLSGDYNYDILSVSYNNGNEVRQNLFNMETGKLFFNRPLLCVIKGYDYFNNTTDWIEIIIYDKDMHNPESCKFFPATGKLFKNDGTEVNIDDLP